MYNLTATYRDSKLFIATYETEEPKCNGKPYCCEGKRCEWLDWNETKESHKREYSVSESDSSALIVLLEQEEIRLNPNTNWVNGEFKTKLEKGIDCTFLKDRLKFCVDCTDNICQGECGMCDKMEKMWTLLPLEDKKENEAVEFGMFVFNHMKKYPNSITPIKQLHELFKNPNKQ